MSAHLHLHLCGRKAAEWLIAMKNLPAKSKRFFILACLMSSLESVAISLSLYYMAQILEFAQAGQRKNMLWMVAVSTGLLLAAYFLYAASTAARLGYLSSAEVSLKRDIMKNVLRRPWKGFQRKNRGYYLNLLTTDTDMYRTDRMDSVTLICGYAISGVVASVMLCLMNTWLFVAGILISATPLICSKFFTNMQRRTRGAFSARSEEYANVLKETVDGYEVIHTSNQSGNFLDRFEEASAQKQRALFFLWLCPEHERENPLYGCVFGKYYWCRRGRFPDFAGKPKRGNDAGSNGVLFRNFQQPFQPH